MRNGRLLQSLCTLGVLLWFSPKVFADVYVYQDKNGVMTFTNVPTHTGFRRVLKESNGPGIAASPLNFSYDSLIRTASGRYRVDADLIRAIIKTESDFNAAARSQKGAMGLMQLMPDTARLHNVVNAYDPGENVEGGVRHFKMLLDRYQGNLELSLAAYNAGSAAVDPVHRQRARHPAGGPAAPVRALLHDQGAWRGNGVGAADHPFGGVAPRRPDRNRV